MLVRLVLAYSLDAQNVPVHHVQHATPVSFIHKLVGYVLVKVVL
jgi:hypothetical protein